MLSSRQLRTASEGERVAGAAELAVGLDRMERVVGDLQRRALSLRTAPLLRVLDALPRLARDLARQTGKRVEVELSGAELELDRAILDRLGDPLVHLVRNAVDHGIEPPAERRAAGKAETGLIAVDARRDKDTIRISVRDDGGGIDLEAVRARAVESGALPTRTSRATPPGGGARVRVPPGALDAP